MRAVDILLKKRRGAELSADEIEYLISGYVSGEVPDYQMSAFLTSVCFRSMTERETDAMCRAMRDSGDVLDLSRFGESSCDKHSTGGVGDKTSLVVCPIIASLGLVTAKMSGRGLGHTGGTVDKLESIPGFKSALSPREFMEQAERCGIVLTGQSARLAPADGLIYALRDATSTVDSIPLIATSIMSKKLAGGASNIALDVKVGSGAFMKTEAEAEKLAREMVRLGRAAGKNVEAVLTDMDEPLGRAVGNSLEVIEAVDVLTGRSHGRLRDLCLTLASHLVSMARGISDAEALAEVTGAVDSGAAFEKMTEWISVQGGDARYLENTELFEKAPCVKELKARSGGTVLSLDAEKIGRVSSALGAGRMKKGDRVDPAAGLLLSVSVGDTLRPEDTVATLFTSNEDNFAEAERLFFEALSIGDGKKEPSPLVIGTVK